MIPVIWYTQNWRQLSRVQFHLNRVSWCIDSGMEQNQDPIVAVITTAVFHHNDVIMGTMVSQFTRLTMVYSTIYSDADKKYQSSGWLAFVRGIHRWPVNSPHKGPVTRWVFPFDDVIVWFKGNMCRSWVHWSTNVYVCTGVPILY